MTDGDLFDVVAVNIKTGEERFIVERETRSNADAIETMCVIRRGCDVEFFKTVPTGSPKGAAPAPGGGEHADRYFRRCGL